MRHSRPANVTAVLLSAALLLQPAVGACEGLVGFQLEMGSSARQTYQCIFVGTITSQGKPCPGAHIVADLAAPRGEAVTELVDADAQGRYELRVKLDGTPKSETLWKLTAKAAVIGAASSEIEGRVILAEDATVTIDRSIQLDATGV